MADGITDTNEVLSASSLQRLIDIGIALSAERDTNVLMETILLEAKSLSNADGGTLYIRTKDNRLRFEVMRTDSLNIAMGSTTGKDINFPPLALYDAKTGEENHKNVASAAALTGKSINVPDAYESDDFDFSGTKRLDEGKGYRSKSFLYVPLRNSQEKVIGVLQLLNAVDSTTGDVIHFGRHIQPLIEALASQAAVALDNQQLLEAQKKLLDSIIELIASAIDAKLPYTGGHCQRVPELTKMLASAACEETEGPFADFDLTEEEWYELHIAAWLHDCGKVTTPEYVVDKVTKLETIYNRIHEIRNRFEIVKRDRVITYLNAVIDSGDPDQLRADLETELAQIGDDFNFIGECNVGGEFMAPEKIERVKEIAKTKWTRTLSDRAGLSYEELKRIEREPEPELPFEESLYLIATTMLSTVTGWSLRRSRIIHRDSSSKCRSTNIILAKFITCVSHAVHSLKKSVSRLMITSCKRSLC